ncbi:hypothetical protein [Pantoea ananatis]|uniref:hypothetical protein n=1 Tax=Pantoea ananas TaxID=553 RepID=UPI001B30D81A|nr:hypothetical protein [Pantoea ananatis]
MQTSSQPKLLPVPFADGGSKQTIPMASQIGITAGRASYTDGFPPLTRTPLAAGGVPPFGTDFNGVLNDITAAIRWKQSGAGYIFDSAFSTAISGYPKGAKLTNSTFDGFWLNTVDGNTSAPEAADSSLTGWIPADTYGVTALTGLAGSSVTLSSLQASRPRITLAGTLSANINLTVPAWTKSWLIENNTTGAFSVTVKTPSGSGVAIPAGTKASVYGNGTNIALDNQTLNVSTQVTGIVGQARNLGMSVTTASATATVTADEIIVGTALGGSQYRIGSFSKTINLATTGAGGMDTGTVPTTGYVGIYAIFNPTTGVSALLAVNATSAAVPEIYGGANMPSGYTASALVSVWGIAASKFIPGFQTGRTIKTQQLNLLTTTTPTTTPTALTISPGAPLNTRKIQLSLNVTQTTSGNGVGLVLQSDSTGIGSIGQLSATSSGTSANGMYCEISLITQGQIYYVMNNTSSASYTVKSLGYEI